MIKKLPLLLMLALALLLSACNIPEMPAEASEINQTPAETPEALFIPETSAAREELRNLMTARVSQVLDAEVLDNEGQQLGQVTDVVLSPFALPEYLVVSIGERYFLVPWTAFIWDTEGQRAVYGLPRETLNDAPALSNEEELQALDTAGWDQDVAGYWVELVNIPGATDQRPASGDVPRRLTQALQSTVVDFEGETIGQVVDFLYNQAQQRGYVVVEQSSSFVPVPLEEFDWDRLNGRLIYLYEMDRMGNAPAYSSLDELQAGGNSWDEEIVRYWRQP